MYDVVWCTQENRAKALELLVRIPDEELSRRNSRFGIRNWENCPVPDREGRQTKLVGNAIATDFYGSARLSPGAYKGGVLYRMEFLDLEEVEPGLVGAKIRPEFHDLPDVLAAAAETQRIEEHNRKSEEEEREQRLALSGEKKIDALRRLFCLGARSLGIGSDVKCDEQELQDAYMAASMAGKPLPSAGAWLSLLSPEDEPERQRSQYDDMDFWSYTAAVRSAVVQRQERKA